MYPLFPFHKTAPAADEAELFSKLQLDNEPLFPHQEITPPARPVAFEFIKFKFLMQTLSAFTKNTLSTSGASIVWLFPSIVIDFEIII